MTFDEWLDAYFSGTQIDVVVAGAMRDAFEAGKREAGAVVLRDKFAMAALQGMLARPAMKAISAVVVEWAYKYADAMLKERVK